jgi:hypothetical protein
LGGAVTYGDDKFVSLANGSSQGAYSLNGVDNWTPFTLPFSQNWYHLIFNKNKFIAGSGSDIKRVYSSDGIIWNFFNLPGTSTNRRWNSIAFGNGYFVAPNHNQPSFFYSPDGINWNLNETLPNIGIWNSIAYGNGKFVIVRGGSTGSNQSLLITIQ